MRRPFAVCEETDQTMVWVMRVWASVMWKVYFSMSSRHSFVFRPGVGSSRVSSMDLKLVHGAKCSGRLAPVASRGAVVSEGCGAE
jgi:hypothetical protein